MRRRGPTGQQNGQSAAALVSGPDLHPTARRRGVEVDGRQPLSRRSQSYCPWSLSHRLPCWDVPDAAGSQAHRQASNQLETPPPNSSTSATVRLAILAQRRVMSMLWWPSIAAMASRLMPRLMAWVARVWRIWWGWTWPIPAAFAARLSSRVMV